MKYVLLSIALLGAVVSAPMATAEIESAVPIRTVGPEYPAELLRERINGLVVVAFIVTARGDVTEPTVVKSTRKEFEPSAVEAVKKWKFKPAKDNGVPIARRITVPIEFKAEAA